MSLVLKDEIGLRKYQNSDASSYLQAVRESIATTYPFEAYFHPKYSLSDVENWGFNSKYDIDGYHYIIYHKKSERILGSINLRNIIKYSEYAEMGYFIRESERGKGIAGIACQLMLAHAFNTVGLNRIEFWMLLNNVPSQRVLEKLGAKREGVCRQRFLRDGQFQDLVLYAILKEEYFLNGQ